MSMHLRFDQSAYEKKFYSSRILQCSIENSFLMQEWIPTVKMNRLNFSPLQKPKGKQM